jgi:hypothetical protein
MGKRSSERLSKSRILAMKAFKISHHFEDGVHGWFTGVLIEKEMNGKIHQVVTVNDYSLEVEDADVHEGYNISELIRRTFYPSAEIVICEGANIWK